MLYTKSACLSILIQQLDRVTPTFVFYAILFKSQPGSMDSAPAGCVDAQTCQPVELLIQATRAPGFSCCLSARGCHRCLVSQHNCSALLGKPASNPSYIMDISDIVDISDIELLWLWASPWSWRAITPFASSRLMCSMPSVLIPVTSCWWPCISKLWLWKYSK